MKSISDKTKINSMELKNRFFRAAIGDVTFKGGHIQDEGFELYEELLKGGTGTILTGFATVCDYDMTDNEGMFRIDKDEYIEEYQELTSLAHEYDSNIIMQIVHIGSYTFGEYDKIYAPSVVKNEISGKIPTEEISKEDIKRIQQAFINGVIRAKKAGFDGVEIHAAHSYFLSEFLSPHYNKRTDEYGGSDENRARIVVEIIEQVREKVGKDYPILVKINCDDALLDGTTLEGFLTACKLFEQAGADAIEVSGSFVELRGEKPYYLEQAKKLSETVNIPVILTGGIRNIDDVNEILNTTNIEYFGLGRPLMREPDLVNKWLEKEQEKAKCITCNGCIKYLTDMKCIFRK